MDPTDPVLVRRAKIAAMVRFGQRLGAAGFAFAVVTFFASLIWGFTLMTTTLIVAGLVIGSVALAPAIVFGYAVKAAEREDQGLPSGH